jgi:hypothetical protein
MRVLPPAPGTTRLFGSHLADAPGRETAATPLGSRDGTKSTVGGDSADLVGVWLVDAVVGQVAVRVVGVEQRLIQQAPNMHIGGRVVDEGAFATALDPVDHGCRC